MTTQPFEIRQNMAVELQRALRSLWVKKGGESNSFYCMSRLKVSEKTLWILFPMRKLTAQSEVLPVPYLTTELLQLSPSTAIVCFASVLNTFEL